MNTNNLYRKFSLIFLFIFFANVFPQSDSLINEIIAPQNRYHFANYLFSQQDYYRANNEYRQYLQYENNDTVRFKMGYSLIEMGEYSQAQDYLKALFVSTKLKDEAKSLYFKTLYLEKNYLSFDEKSKLNLFQSSNYQNNINCLKNFMQLETSQTIFDTTKFYYLYKPNVRDTIKSFYLQKFFPDNKSEMMAALLSTLIPGLGKIYTGQVGDGITAFIFNSILGYLAYNNFKNDHNFRGWLFSVLGVYFYAGNIYGSIVSAKIYNSHLQIQLGIDMNRFIKSQNYFLPDYSRLLK